jgi:hypothetical protein
MIPDDAGAAVVLIDRVTTGGAERSLHLRVRTPSSLSLSGDVASSTLGSSSLAVRKVWASSGTASVRSMPQASECPSSSHTCDVSKLPAGTEYRLDVSGPSASAIHVVSAAAPGAESPGQLLTGPGYRGVIVQRSAVRVAVVTSDTGAPAAGGVLSYRVPAAANVVHVVVDAPTDAAGASDVSAALDGPDCKVEVKAHTGVAPGLEGRPLVVRLQADCSVQDDGTQAPVQPDPGGPAVGGMPAGGAGSTPATPTGAGGSSGAPASGIGGDLVATTRASGASGCGVTRARARRVPAWALGLLGLSLARRRRVRRA